MTHHYFSRSTLLAFVAVITFASSAAIASPANTEGTENNSSTAVNTNNVNNTYIAAYNTWWQKAQQFAQDCGLDLCTGKIIGDATLTGPKVNAFRKWLPQLKIGEIHDNTLGPNAIRNTFIVGLLMNLPASEIEKRAQAVVTHLFPRLIKGITGSIYSALQYTGDNLAAQLDTAEAIHRNIFNTTTDPEVLSTLYAHAPYFNLQNMDSILSMAQENAKILYAADKDEREQAQILSSLLKCKSAAHAGAIMANNCQLLASITQPALRSFVVDFLTDAHASVDAIETIAKNSSFFSRTSLKALHYHSLIPYLVDGHIANVSDRESYKLSNDFFTSVDFGPRVQQASTGTVKERLDLLNQFMVEKNIQ